jgi:hypothetical protein
METCTAVLLDTVSIQQYIFQSNRLKDNIGASYLVQDIFNTHLVAALAGVSGSPAAEIQTSLDRLGQSDMHPQQPECSPDKPWDIGYIGGGNCLLFFQQSEIAQQFITTWTRRLLIQAPGLATAVALVDDFSSDPARFQSQLSSLFQCLRDNKGRYSPNILLPRHGITAECPRSGLSAEGYSEVSKEYISAGSRSVIRAAKVSKEKLEEKYLQGYEQEFCFSNELDELGGIAHEDSHIAIVHIDGNSVGELFRRAADLRELRVLSCRVNQAVEDAFAALVSRLVQPEQYSRIMRVLGYAEQKSNASEQAKKSLVIGRLEYTLSAEILQTLRDELPAQYVDLLQPLTNTPHGGREKFSHAVRERCGTGISAEEIDFLCQQAAKRKILPIRPIILGGDDITFVCDGKLGIYFAGLLMAAMAKTEIKQQPLTSCAGIAIIKTKYPFYRGYLLAEQLCANAKKQRISEGSNDCWLDFHIAMAGIEGPLEQIRARGYDNRFNQGSLLYRPLPLSGPGRNQAGLPDLIRACGHFITSQWPGSKLNALREALLLPEDGRRDFVAGLKFRGLDLPQLSGRATAMDFTEDLFADSSTPYFDILEIMRFYPDFALLPPEKEDEQI